MNKDKDFWAKYPIQMIKPVKKDSFFLFGKDELQYQR